MRPEDLPAVEEVAAQVHPDYPEDPAVFIERLRLHPQGCRTLWLAGRPSGYLISHPWRLAAPPKLNTPLGALPAHPDAYYLHDLALLPAVRGGGHAAAAVAWVEAHARALGLDRVALVSLADAVRFWLRQGFDATEEPVPGILASYDAGARFMVRHLSRSSSGSTAGKSTR